MAAHSSADGEFTCDLPLNPSKKKLLEHCAEALRQISYQYCEGGYGQPYPDEVAVVGDHIVVATVDAGKEYAAPELLVYTREQMEHWYYSAVQNYWEYRQRDRHWTLIDYLREDRP